MNGNHLPAGQPMPGGVGGAASGPGLNGGRRRPPPSSSYSTHQPYQQHQHQQHPGSIYQGTYHMNPYATSYYPPHQVAHPYQTGHMPNTPYSIPPYTTYPQRSPPTIHQAYPPIVSSSMQAHPQPYARPPPQQPSPALSTPPPFITTAPPPPPPAPVPQTPTSTHSSQVAAAPLSPPTSQPQADAAPRPEIKVMSAQAPFKYPLPWLSHPDEPFPSRTTKSRRRRRKMGATTSVELPMSMQNGVEPEDDSKIASSNEPTAFDTPKPKTASTVASAVDPTSETSSIHDPPREEHLQSTSSTPVSAKALPASATSPSTKTNKSTARTAVPAVPVFPAMPKTSPKETKSLSSSEDTQVATPSSSVQTDEVAQAPAETTRTEPEIEPTPAQPTKAAPKLWSGLFQRAMSAATPSTGPNSGSTTTASGAPASDATNVANGISGPGSFAKSNANSLAEALRAYQVSNGHKIAFLEPRGLINTGNMCYMNSVLQVLIFCIPFYDFLDQVSKKAAYSFKSETPLIDAMVMFLREYKVIDSAVSVDQLRRRLKSEELEQYGDAFTPELVYDAIKQLPRFASMQRGHQQDAEEFLGFLLEALHDECAQVMRHLNESSAATTAANSSTATPTGASSPTSTTDASDWLEVGRKQRAAITRSSGHPMASSPITKIFGGQLRSVLKVPGLKDSVTLEPFQPLQLDIGAPHIRNIMDALKGLTRTENMHGDFGSPRGAKAQTTKQVLIESVPPVLILHLKRFQFDPTGTGTVKIWKKVDYPLELELPKEVFSPQKRNALNAEGVGFPKYRLIAAVYHHGKNASGGHYTVDLRRQDGREWIRLDDTVIRRIRSEDVAEGGVEGDTAKSATWTDQKQNVVGSATGNRFEGIGDEDEGDEEGWNKVSAPANGAKKWSSVVNGSGSSNAIPAKGKSVKDNMKDNKVAYLLFYQKI
ncbi:cysteine proteinase [Xylariaceae sp. AK1471]|nr:cysteine proteinase [Xylariaceae sp. AK1471]